MIKPGDLVSFKNKNSAGRVGYCMCPGFPSRHMLSGDIVLYLRSEAMGNGPYDFILKGEETIMIYNLLPALKKYNG